MIELARQAGFAEPERIISTDTVRCVPDLAYFFELVVQKEREACAKLLERTDLGGLKSDVWLQNYTATILDGYAKAIRARGQS
jgi:hypothetical protein